MKKIFSVLFFVVFLCPFLFAEIEYALPDANLMKEVNSFINQSFQNDPDSLFHKEPSLNANYSSVFHVSFTRNSMIESNSKQETVTNKSGCVAVALNEKWLLASGHCFWDESIIDAGLNELSEIDKILSVEYSDFIVTVKNRHIKAISHKLSNLYLLQLTEDEKLDNTPFPYLFISSNKDEERLLNSFHNGHVLVNRTVPNEDSLGVLDRNFVKSNFDPYFSHRNLMSRHIKNILVDNNTNVKTAITGGIMRHRAGDPMFYTEHNKEYLAGFGDALNIPDNMFQNDLRRTHKITLLSLSDSNEILKVINTFDRPSGKIIAKNIVFR